jgi:hypothetical protein
VLVIIQTNKLFNFYILNIKPWNGERMGPLGTLATIWPIVPAHDNEFGAIGGMNGRGN